MKKRTYYGITTAVMAIFAATGTSAFAQENKASQKSDDTVIVTGSAKAQRRFDVSYAVNLLRGQNIAEIAPLNYADLLSTIPGIQVEATGGEVQNITRVRGIPTDRGYLIFQQDGLPFYPEIDGYFFNAGDGMNRTDLMTGRVEVMRGGSSPVYASSAAAISNNILVEGSDTSSGKVQLTIGDTNFYRGDIMQSGKLAKNTYYAVGGFYRYHDGYRENGFPNDKGGQVRGNIKHIFSNGYIKISGTYLNDHNVFYLPIPLADPTNPSLSLNPYIDYFNGTMNTPALRDVTLKYRDSLGIVQTVKRNLEDGRHLQFGNIGVDYKAQFGEWEVNLKSGYTNGKLSFDALYSTANPVNGTTFANSYLTAAKKTFGNNVSYLGYAIAGTNGGTIYNPAVDSGLVITSQYRAINADFYSNQNDLSVTRSFTTGFGRHQIKAGIYGAVWNENVSNIYNDYLLQVKGQPATLDLVAYSNTGAVLGYVTDKGVLRYGTTLGQGSFDAKMMAFYINDTWEISDKLRVDGGIRAEKYHYTGFGLSTASANLGDTTTLADDAVRYFTGAIVNNRFDISATNWALGLNYDFTGKQGIYARVAQLEIPPTASVAFSTSPSLISNKAEQYEIGYKANLGRSYLYFTGFYTKFDPLNASFVAYNPNTGRNDQTVTFVGQAEIKGVEMDGKFAPVKWFSLDGSLTVQDPKYNDLVNSAGADPSAVNGNQIIRVAKIYGDIRPTFNFKIMNNKAKFNLRYSFVGRRYVDYFNQTAMNSFGTLGAGFSMNFKNLDVQIVGNNLTNAKGITEGNPRTDILSGQGTAEAVYGRPLFGRNFRLILSTKW